MGIWQERELVALHWLREAMDNKFLTGKWSPNSTQVPAKKIKNTNKHAETYSTKLNNELNKKDDWNAIREGLKNQGISLNMVYLLN